MKALGFRNLLGLGAIAGGIYYMQKKRGGDMTFASIKDNLRGLVDDLMNKKGATTEADASAQPARSSSASTSRDFSSGSTGYTGSSYTGSGSGSGFGYGGGTNGGGTGGTRH